MNKSLKLAIVVGTILFAVPSHGMFRHGLKLISRITTLKTRPNTTKRFFSNKQLIPYEKKQTDTTATVKKIKDFVLNYSDDIPLWPKGSCQLVASRLEAIDYFKSKITNNPLTLKLYHISQSNRLNEILNSKGLTDIDGNIPKNIRKTALLYIMNREKGKLGSFE